MNQACLLRPCLAALASASLLLGAGLPIPDSAALIKEVQAHQQKMDELRENYTCHRSERVEELDGKGKITKVTNREEEIFFVNGHQIKRLVAKEGKPLSEAEDKKEQERARKLTLEFANKPPSFGGGGGVNIIATVLAVAEISNPRRTLRNGRSTLTFDFKGNPKAEAHGMAANGAKKLAGTVWIDEADRQVARLDVAFYDNFRIGGGLLASVGKGTVLKIEQAPVGDGLWMQTVHDRHMNLRVITKSVHENSQIRNFDFKRFNVDAVEKSVQLPSSKESGTSK